MKILRTAIKTVVLFIYRNYNLPNLIVNLCLENFLFLCKFLSVIKN